MKKLLIIGCGGHAKVVYETAIATSSFSEFAFLDDKYENRLELNDDWGKWEIIGKISDLRDPNIRDNFKSAVVAIGENNQRLSTIKQLIKYSYKLPTLIHPSATVSVTAEIGIGSVVFAQSVIQAKTKIGIGSIINNSASINHDCIVEDGVHICPGVNIAGGVTIGEKSWIGIGSTVIEGVKIGRKVTIGAGASVISEIPDGMTAVGVPAKLIKSI